jgi:hypothetical protein
VSRYDLFRKRIAPIAFVAAMALLVRESCNKQERTHATIVMDFGAAEPNVVAVDARLSIDGSLLSTFHHGRLAGQRIGKPRFETAMPEHDGSLQIDVELETGHRQITRAIHVEEAATVTLSLGPDLAP